MLLIGKNVYKKILIKQRSSKRHRMKLRDSDSRDLQSKKLRSSVFKDYNLRKQRDSDYSDYRNRKLKDSDLKKRLRSRD